MLPTPVAALVLIAAMAPTAGADAGAPGLALIDDAMERLAARDLAEGLRQLDRGSPRAALAWLESATELAPGDPRPRAAVARASLRAGELERALRAWRAHRTAGGVDAGLDAELARALRREGRDGDALAVLTGSLGASPDTSPGAGTDRSVPREPPREPERAGPRRDGVGDRGAPAERFTGDPERATALLRAAIARAPQEPAAHRDLGAILRAAGRSEEAELELLRAIALAPGDAAAQEELGRLLLETGRAREAAASLRRAAEVLPQRPELQLALAEASQAHGDRAGARAHLDRYLELTGGGAGTWLEARASGSDGPAGPVGESIAAAPAPAPAPVAGTLRVARERLAAGAPEEAIAALEAAPAHEDDAEMLLLRGRILRVAGRPRDAAATLLRAVRADPSSADAAEEAGLALVAAGDLAAGRVQLERAEAQGRSRATIALVELDLAAGGPLPPWLDDLARPWRLVSALHRLDRAAPGPAATGGPAASLRAQAIARMRGAAAAGTALLATFVALVVVTRRRRRTLAKVLRAHPEAGPGVHRALVALRHEVVKHLLAAAAGAESGAGAPLELDLRSGARRVEASVEELLAVAAGQGIELCAGDDPLLARLRRLHRELLGAAGVGPVGAGMPARPVRARLWRALREIDAETSSLLALARPVPLDRELLLAAWSQVRGEPAFAGQAVEPVSLECPAVPPTVWMPRTALEEVLRNLVRNALEASRAGGAPAPVVGLAVREEIDPVTGARSALLVVQDDAGPLAEASVRQPRPGGGLDVVARRLAPFEGAIDVLPAGGRFRKALAIRLPAIEPALRTARGTDRAA